MELTPEEIEHMTEASYGLSAILAKMLVLYQAEKFDALSEILDLLKQNTQTPEAIEIFFALLPPALNRLSTHITAATRQVDSQESLVKEN